MGNAITGMFSGGGSAPVEAAPAANAQTQNHQLQNNCAGAAQQFTKCMDDQNGNMQICNWYLEQLVRPLPFARSLHFL